MKKTNLIKVFLLKEKKFWKRTWDMHKKFNWLGKLSVFLVSLIIITIAHYSFALMHFLFECFLWLFMRGQFKLNLIKLQQ